MAPSIFTEWVELGPRGSGLGILCPGRTMGRSYRCWGMGGPPGHLPVSGSTDLEDMSVMVLRTQGPAALFDDHKLVLHASSSDAKRARVFHACGEFMPILPCRGRDWVGASVSPPGSALAPGLPWGSEEEQSDVGAPGLVSWHPWHSRAQGGVIG